MPFASYSPLTRTQGEIVKASGKSLGWVSAMSRWAPDRHTSPFGPTTKTGRIQHAERRRFKRRNRKRRAEGKGRKTKSRWAALSLKGRPRSMLAYNHQAVEDRRTVYPTTVRMISDDTFVLKSGSNQSKIGGEILKGKWRGFPVYVLTLEERATCPTSCHHWCSCYGNKMRLAYRMQHGMDLERRLEWEVACRADDHPLGFISTRWSTSSFGVNCWTLHIWGYTARWHVENDPIAVALVALITSSISPR
jgi:hypothetical protein